MKWVLIYLAISSWDGEIKETKELATFENKVQCQEAIKSLNEKYTNRKYVCGLKEIK